MSSLCYFKRLDFLILLSERLELFDLNWRRLLLRWPRFYANHFGTSILRDLAAVSPAAASSAFADFDSFLSSWTRTSDSDRVDSCWRPWPIENPWPLLWWQYRVLTIQTRHKCWLLILQIEGLHDSVRRPSKVVERNDSTPQLLLRYWIGRNIVEGANEIDYLIRGQNHDTLWRSVKDKIAFPNATERYFNTENYVPSHSTNGKSFATQRHDHSYSNVTTWIHQLVTLERWWQAQSCSVTCSC